MESIGPSPLVPPLYYSTARLARLLGPEWSARRVRDWLVRNDAAIQRGPRHWYTTPELLRERLPEMWQRLAAILVGDVRRPSTTPSDVDDPADWFDTSDEEPRESAGA